MKLHLHEVSAEDIPIFFEHLQDPVATHMAAFTPEDPSDLEAHMAHWQKLLSDDTIIKRSILLNDELVGHIASWVQEEEREITYWIGTDHWGHGVATKALEVFLTIMRSRPVYARTAADNDGSVHVLMNCGFALHDAIRGFANARGEEIDELVYKLG
ncbi:MAG: GNAT family N-acetyltransferase [Actinomycetota bacterium]|nr:GNAT family N-acetyltransferase [Actinomycetota bacterium]